MGRALLPQIVLGTTSQIILFAHDPNATNKTQGQGATSLNSTGRYFPNLITEYLVNISKRRAFWSLNEDILKIYYSDNQYAVSIKEDTAYPCLHSPKTTKETSLIRCNKDALCGCFNCDRINVLDLRMKSPTKSLEKWIALLEINMALPPRDQRHQYLRVQVFDFRGLPDLMAEGLSARMLMEHRDAQGEGEWALASVNSLIMDRYLDWGDIEEGTGIATSGNVQGTDEAAGDDISMWRELVCEMSRRGSDSGGIWGGVRGEVRRWSGADESAGRVERAMIVEKREGWEWPGESLPRSVRGSSTIDTGGSVGGSDEGRKGVELEQWGGRGCGNGRAWGRARPCVCEVKVAGGAGYERRR
ncbi:hypothetical protein Tco_0648649 [Tanacetum coccineum]